MIKLCCETTILRLGAQLLFGILNVHAPLHTMIDCATPPPSPLPSLPTPPHPTHAQLGTSHQRPAIFINDLIQ
jgi:hypothetical protein